MMFRALALSLLVAAQTADAFQLIIPKTPTLITGASNGWRAPMSTKMVAGGAERAYGGEEYYEGEYFATLLVCGLLVARTATAVDVDVESMERGRWLYQRFVVC
jgi:hypothetical protein